MDKKRIKSIISAMHDISMSLDSLAHEACSEQNTYLVYDLVGQSRKMQVQAQSFKRRYDTE